MATAPGTILDVDHRSAEWYAARCGMVTASRVIDVVTTVKKGEAAARKKYRNELIAERLTGIPTPEGYVSPEMRWGIEHEKFARAAYEIRRNTMVEPCGFFSHALIDRFGASPDCLVGSDGMAQIKCPNTSTHIEWMRAGVVPVEHQPQMLAELSCSGRNWSDFVSFDPRLPEHLQLFIVRYERIDKFINLMESEIRHFNAEIETIMASLPQAGAR